LRPPMQPLFKTYKHYPTISAGATTTATYKVLVCD
jgi:hypothetical protein